MAVTPSAASVRTPRISGGREHHDGWGAGTGTVERYYYLCPCGDGEIVEEHDNVPGFREHGVRILCDKCHAEWRLDDSRGVRAWGLEPIAVAPAL